MLALETLERVARHWGGVGDARSNEKRDSRYGTRYACTQGIA